MNKIYLIFAVGMFITACQKRYELTSLNSFNVKTDSLTYKVGDSIRFVFSGNPDNIVFWSGENGSVYDYRSRTFIEGNSILLNFNSYSQYGDADQSDLQLLVSTDFSGVYDSANIKAATWSDITNQAILSSGQDQTPSGNINLNNFTSLNKNMVLAFRYITSVVKNSASQNRWLIRSLDVTSINDSGQQSTVFDMSTAGWVSFNFSGQSTNWTITSSQIYTARNFTDLDDDWAVTKQFNPNEVSPDQGLAIKNISQSRSEYKAAYSSPGTYKAVFVATNANLKDSKSVVKEIELKIIQ